jgi:hypothetical protein
MSYPASYPTFHPETIEGSRLSLTPRILQLADGDKEVAAQIREAMWGEYRHAGAPLGHSEEGMMVWWHDELEG